MTTGTRADTPGGFPPLVLTGYQGRAVAADALLAEWLRLKTTVLPPAEMAAMCERTERHLGRAGNPPAGAPAGG